MDNIRIFYQKNSVRVRTAILHDVCELKDRLRSEHVAEVWASNNHTPERALLFSYYVSDVCLTLEYDGRILAMAGISPAADAPGFGSIWLLASAEVDQLKLTFMKISRMVLQYFAQLYPGLFNWVDARYVTSIHWLKRLGAKFEEPIPFGPEGLPFCRFTIGGTANV